jgi:hypothetical protein
MPAYNCHLLTCITIFDQKCIFLFADVFAQLFDHVRNHKHKVTLVKPVELKKLKILMKYSEI